MPTRPLPRTAGCLVCGRDNPHGLRLRLHHDDATGAVTTSLRVDRHRCGFGDVAHGGLIATVADEAMAWAAAMSIKRFGLCGELIVRFRRPAMAGATIAFEARIEQARPRLVTTTFRCVDADGIELSSGSAKYIPMLAEQHAEVMRSILDEDVPGLARFPGAP